MEAVLPLVQILGLAAALFVLFSLLFLSPAIILLRERQDAVWRFMVAPGISVLIWAGVAVAAIPVGRGSLATFLTGAVALIVAAAVNKGAWQLLMFCPEVRRGFALWFCYYLVAVAFSVFPGTDLAAISYGTAIRLSDLAVDNLIPYNVSRYLVERLDPRTLEVVPTWSFVDRGPLAGVLNALLFFLLRLEDGGHWLEARGVLYLVYESLLCFLNSWVVVLVWLVARRNVSETAAQYATLLLASTHFCLVNTFFSWPKWFMCALLLAALEALRRREWFVVGLLFGGAVLAHDAAWLSILPIVGFALLLQLLRRSVSWGAWFRRAGIAVGSFALVLAPWIIAKTYFAPPHPTQLVALQLFCVPDARSLGDRSTLELAREYLANTTASELLSVRVKNLAFPFDVTFVLKSLLVDGVMAAATQTAHNSFKIFLLGVGPLTFLVFLWAAIAHRKSWCGVYREELLGGFGALLLAASILGCEFLTVNHQWAYLAFVTVALGAGTALAALGPAGRMLLLLGVCLNVALGILSFRLTAKEVDWSHAPMAFWFMVFTLITCFAITLLYPVPRSEIAPKLSSWWVPVPAFILTLCLVLLLQNTIAAGISEQAQDSTSPRRTWTTGEVDALLDKREVGLLGTEQVFWGDFDGDKVSDLAVFDAFARGSFDRAPINWQLYFGAKEAARDYRAKSLSWGLPGDRAVVGDFNGDRVDDIGVVNPQTMQWSMLYSADSRSIIRALTGDSRYGRRRQWGLPGDVPVVGDLDGDRRFEFGVFRPSAGKWLFAPNDQDARQSIEFGGVGALPLAADFDGDLLTELAVYRPDVGEWLLRFRGKGVKSISWSVPNGHPLSVDIDGNQALDLAFYLPGDSSQLVVLPLTEEDYTAHPGGGPLLEVSEVYRRVVKIPLGQKHPLASVRPRR